MAVGGLMAIAKKLLGNGIVLAIFILIIINFMFVVIQTGSLAQGASELAKLVISPSVQLEGISQSIIKNGGIWFSTLPWYKNIINIILNFWNITQCFYVIYLWWSVIFLFCLWAMFDNSKVPPAFIFATILLFLMQVIVLVVLNWKFGTDYNLLFPLISLADFVTALITIFHPLTNQVNNYVNSSTSGIDISSIVNGALNSTNLNVTIPSAI